MDINNDFRHERQSSYKGKDGIEFLWALWPKFSFLVDGWFGRSLFTSATTSFNRDIIEGIESLWLISSSVQAERPQVINNVSLFNLYFWSFTSHSYNGISLSFCSVSLISLLYLLSHNDILDKRSDPWVHNIFITSGSFLLSVVSLGLRFIQYLQDYQYLDYQFVLVIDMFLNSLSLYEPRESP